MPAWHLAHQQKRLKPQILQAPATPQTQPSLFQTTTQNRTPSKPHPHPYPPDIVATPNQHDPTPNPTSISPAQPTIPPLQVRYSVQLRRGSRHWSIARRYRDWLYLREGLFGVYGFDAPFPPKRAHGLLGMLCLGDHHVITSPTQTQTRNSQCKPKPNRPKPKSQACRSALTDTDLHRFALTQHPVSARTDSVMAKPEKRTRPDPTHTFPKQEASMLSDRADALRSWSQQLAASKLVTEAPVSTFFQVYASPG